MKTKINLLLLALLFLNFTPLMADAPNVGLIFNTTNMLSGNIEDYQGGIGVKVSDIDIAGFSMNARGTLGLTILEGADNWGIDGGLAVEAPFMKGPISPYAGLFMNFGYRKITVEVPGENSDSSTEFSEIRFGPIIGVEIFVWKNFTLFAEYQLAFSNTQTTLINNGEKEEPESNWETSTGLGNYGMIGIVVYFKATGRNWKNEN